jgi:hypothetical protein
MKKMERKMRNHRERYQHSLILPFNSFAVSMPYKYAKERKLFDVYHVHCGNTQNLGPLHIFIKH